MKPLWTPSKQRIAATNLEQFRHEVNKRFALELSSYVDLHAWSVREPSHFWAFYADYSGLNFSSKAQTILSDKPMPYSQWFEGARLNYAQNLLYPANLKREEQIAILSVSETGFEQELSYRDLRIQVARCAAALKKQGLKKGDRVAAFATNLAETTIVFLACSSLGLIFSSCSPDFGYEAARARFAQIEPKLLFAAPLYFYGAKRFDTLATAEALLANIASIEKLVLLPYPGVEQVKSDKDRVVPWSDFLEASEQLVFEQLPFDHPLYILFSSGTTGLPKAMVHRAGGALLKHHTEMHLHSDIKAADKMLYFTTCGWMMWNWLISGLAQAATIVQFEGSPAYPDLERLWRLAEKHQLNFFGTSARYLHTLQAQNLNLIDELDLSSVKTIASTGSPLSASGFEYVYSSIKKDVHLASISGGTDIVGCFMLGIPTQAVYAGQIQGPALGVDLRVVNENGEPVIGELGELVVANPLPSMPLYFWNDPDYEKYKKAYFEPYGDWWRHGDLISFTAQGGVIVYGRSDATLNPGGVRIGTAEIYRPLESFPEIVDACAVAKKQDQDEEIWLFLVLAESYELDDLLLRRIRAEIRAKASPRHVPGRVLQVSQLPRTRSGKAMEIAVSRLLNGLSVPNREVMANPEVLIEIENLL